MMKKWLFGAVALIAAALIGVIAVQVATGLRSPSPVGFQLVSVPDPPGAPLSVAVWYPTRSSPSPALIGLVVQFVAENAPVSQSHLPLVVMSHGSGGGPGSHADTALALASSGFVVAAPMHTGDNFADQSAVGTSKWLVDRARHIPAVIDHLLTTWPDHAKIDGSKIGIFGFSAGAFTALTAVGGSPNLAMIGDHCSRQPEFACQLWKPGASQLPAGDAFAHDARIKAAVIAAPGYGFSFAPDGLVNVMAPVQLWSGERDAHVPTASNAAVVNAALRNVEFRIVPGAQHFSFLVPCGLIGPPSLCREVDGFDRERFHQQLNREVVQFLREKLDAPTVTGAARSDR